MKIKLYSVYDKKVSAYGNPVPAKTEPEIIRMIADAISYGDTILAKHPEDFDLYHIADLDLVSGLITPPDSGKPTYVTAVFPIAESSKDYEVGDDA